MSLQLHKLSHCCQVPILGNENNSRGICSNCKQPCNVQVVDDGERAYRIKMASIKHRSIAQVTKQVIVTGFSLAQKRISVEFKDRSGISSYCLINHTDFFKWASANSYLCLLPETEYVGGAHWDKQPHHINRQLNATEMVRFYNSIDKTMLENYLNHKIHYQYAQTA